MHVCQLNELNKKTSKFMASLIQQNGLHFVEYILCINSQTMHKFVFATKSVNIHIKEYWNSIGDIRFSLLIGEAKGLGSI